MQTRRTEHLTDWIQEACIERMNELEFCPVDIAGLVSNKIQPDHTIKYLTRRAPMVSWKLQHLLDALGLTIGAEQP